LGFQRGTQGDSKYFLPFSKGDARGIFILVKIHPRPPNPPSIPPFVKGDQRGIEKEGDHVGQR